jgi:magnesium-transporting ATPase (P-type)
MARAPTPKYRPADTSEQSFNPLLLWLGILGGPLAFALVRLAGIVLLTGPCANSAGSATLLGLSSSQQLMAAITIVCALIAGASGILSWHIWRQTGRREEEQLGGSIRSTPFWALGGVFLSGVFFIIIILTGGLAIGLSTPCTS